MDNDGYAPQASPCVVVGAGPAGLMAAEVMAQAGRRVVVHDASPSPARKFLLAGRGGLNLTHSEPIGTFLSRYGVAAERLRPAIEAFPPQALRDWAAGLGEETFVGTSGRVFPKSFKATPLLRAWLRRLAELGVELRLRSRFAGFGEDGALRFSGPSSDETIRPGAAVFALGGASWPRLGADGGWVEAYRAVGIEVANLRPANCGFVADWSPRIRKAFAGAPLKSIALAHGGARVRGEAVVTTQGLEGGAIYALSASLREAIAAHGSATLAIDFKPDVSEAALAARLTRKPGQSVSTLLRKSAGLAPAAIALLREAGPLPENAEGVSARIKRCELRLVGTAPIARAISTAGGVAWREIGADFMLTKRPGVFVAGEMIDWEAPTGGIPSASLLCDRRCGRPGGGPLGNLTQSGCARGCDARSIERLLGGFAFVAGVRTQRREDGMGETGLDKLKTVLRVVSGNFLEMYDFFLFGIYARQIAHTFFPNDDPYASLMLTFLSFAAGFAMRPIGALVLGPYIDRIGRRKGLIVTLSIMACGTVLIAFVPSYATIGVLAPLLVVLGRLLQGFSAGVELGGVSVYLSEMATPGNKGFYVSWQSASQQVAVVVAALLGFAIANLMAPQAAADWGWRIPFFIGCAIVPFLYWIRRSLEETKEFAARKVHPTYAQIYETLAANWAVVLGGVAMVMMTTVSFYLITVYTPTFGRSVLKLSESDALAGDDGDRGLQFLLAAGGGRALGPHRPQADPDRLLPARALDRLSGAGLARQRAELRPDARGRTVALADLRLVQRRDGRGADRTDPVHGAHRRLLARLQPRHDARRLVARHLDLSDPGDGRQGRARLLDELRRPLRPRSRRSRSTGDGLPRDRWQDHSGPESPALHRTRCAVASPAGNGGAPSVEGLALDGRHRQGRETQPRDPR